MEGMGGSAAGATLVDARSGMRWRRVTGKEGDMRVTADLDGLDGRRAEGEERGTEGRKASMGGEEDETRR